MKRCIICGNTGDENSTVCSVCGGPFEDTVNGRDELSRTQDMAQITRQLEEMLEGASKEVRSASVESQLADVLGSEELAGAKAAVTEIILEKEETPVQEEMTRNAPAGEEPLGKESEKETPKQKEAAGRKTRRMKSEPQIYGQTQMGDMASYNGQQGMMRRNMQGRPMNGAPQGRPMNGAPQGRPVNKAAQSPMNGAPQGRPASGAAQSPVNGAPQGQPVNMTPQNRYVKAVRDTAKKCMRSPLFFLIALLNTVSLAGSVAAIFLKELNYTQFARLITEIGLPVQLVGYADDLMNFTVKLDNSAVIVNLALQIPSLLFCLGLWLVFFCALGAKNEMATSGFSLMKIVVVLQMIVSCAAVLAGLIVSVTLVVAAWASGTQTMIITSIIVMVVMIVAAMLVIMYFFCYFATIKTCRLSAKAGETYGNASAYVAIVQIVLAFTAVITLLSGIVNMEISNIAASAGKMGWMILFGLWIFGYRKSMKEFVD